VIARSFGIRSDERLAHHFVRLALLVAILGCERAASQASIPITRAHHSSRPAGGRPKCWTRIVAEKCKRFGQPVIVEKRRWIAPQMIATTQGAKAITDGYTMTLSSVRHDVLHSLRTKLPMTDEDLEPLG